jgi:hypothetical protein
LPAAVADLRLVEPVATARSGLATSGPVAAAVYLGATGKAFDGIAKTLKALRRTT